QLLGMPWRIAIAMQGSGWILRNAIVWHKPNPMPSSVKDRLNNTYEFIFHFVKSRKYYYDLDAIREKRAFGYDKEIIYDGKNPHCTSKKITKEDRNRIRDRGLSEGFKYETAYNNPSGKNPGDVIKQKSESGIYAIGGKHSGYFNADGSPRFNPIGSNPGDFMQICTQPFPEAHFAVYPEAICIKPIKSSCPKDGIVLDPFVGSGTTMKVARDLGRSSIGIEINPEYVEIIKKRMGWKHHTLVKNWEIIT
ncbi:unnamed protein product, partial [marine sediment metagenome]